MHKKPAFTAKEKLSRTQLIEETLGTENIEGCLQKILQSTGKVLEKIK